MSEKENRLVRAHIRSVLDSISEYEEVSKENGEPTSLDGYKTFLMERMEQTLRGED